MQDAGDGKGYWSKKRNESAIGFKVYLSIASDKAVTFFSNFRYTSVDNGTVKTGELV